jgi:hypothetical protein
VGTKVRLITASILYILLSIVSTSPSLAIDAIPNLPANARWHASDSTATATFLGGDNAELATLSLTKSKIAGHPITINTDATQITLQSGDSPHVTIKIPPNPQGTSTKILMVGGDSPTIFFNDSEQIQQQGKWIQIMSAPDANITLKLTATTFAKVKFDSAAPPAANANLAASDSTPTKTPDTGPELLHSTTAAQLESACTVFDNSLSKKCTACSGNGWTIEKVQTGTQQQGRFVYPVYSDKKVPCSICNGKGFIRSSDDVLMRLASNMVKGMATINQDDPNTQNVMSDAYTEITRDMIGDRPTWTSLTTRGKSILAQKAPRPGSIVVSLVEVQQSIQTPDHHRRFLVRVIGTDRKVYVDDPSLADELKAGKALMGGMVADPLPATADGEPTTVLKGGFLIAPEIKKDWWWWYEDRI